MISEFDIFDERKAWEAHRQREAEVAKRRLREPNSIEVHVLPGGSVRVVFFDAMHRVTNPVAGDYSIGFRAQEERSAETSYVAYLEHENKHLRTLLKAAEKGIEIVRR